MNQERPFFVTTVAYIKERLKLMRRYTPREFSFVLREVLTTSDPEKQRELLLHHLRAVLKEHLRVPFVSYATEIQPEREGLGLFDDRYSFPSVRERCRRAVEAYQDMPAHRDRFALEEEQTELLLTKVTELLTVSGEGEVPVNVVLAWFEELATTADLELDSAAAAATELQTGPIVETLQSQGWRVAPPTFLSREVEKQFGWKHQPDREVWVGQKMLYIMPQSPVHEGFQSIYVIAQPCYLPQENKWLLLHDQHMGTFSWEEHDRVLQKLQTKYQSLPPEKIGTPEHEQHIMAECVELRHGHQLLTAAETFLDVVYDSDDAQAQRLAAEQKERWQRFVAMEKTLDVHAAHILEALSLVGTIAEPGTAAWQEWMYQVMIKTVSTLLQEQPLSPSDKDAWLKTLRDFLANPETQQSPWQLRMKHLALSAQTTPWLSLPVVSQLECVAFSFAGVGKLQAQPLTQGQLANIIGLESAKLWQEGQCSQCKTTTQVLCGLCFFCGQKWNETADATASNTNTWQKNLRQTPVLDAQFNEPPPPASSIGLSSLVSGLLGAAA